MNYSIKQYIFVIHELTAREIKRKYARSVLGIVWSVLNPLLYMAAMSLVFSSLMNRDFNYPVYYTTGYTFWLMFSSATSTAMSAFDDNKRLLQLTKLPRTIFVLSRVYTSFVNLGFSLIALLIVIVFFRVKLGYTLVIVFVDVLLELLFSIGAAFILATVYVFYKDIRFLWNNLMVFMIHIIALYVPIERYPQYIQRFTRLNPLFVYLDIAKKCILYNTFNLDELQYAIIWSIGLFLFGWCVFKCKENEIIKMMQYGK